MKFVAVTACPTGIAHSQMAAEKLQQVAAAAGHDIEVEIQGAMGTQNELSPDVIEGADAVVVAADTAIEGDERFDHKPVVSRPVGDAVTDATGVLRAAVEAAATAREGVAAAADHPEDDRSRDTDGVATRDAEDRTSESVSWVTKQVRRLRRLFG